MTSDDGKIVTINSHQVRITHPDKVMYPATGTTKGDVIAYYTEVAAAIIPLAANRPATRKRWVNGVDEPAFFQKNLDESTPDWVPRRQLKHQDHTNTYPLVNNLETLTWLAQVAALEIHVPQWRFSETGTNLPPDRLVFDLDPGDGVGLQQCAQVARMLRERLQEHGLHPLPVTSGSKGIHLYAPLDAGRSSEQTTALAHKLAIELEEQNPDLVTATIKRSERHGKVFIDWSQNNASKTTVCPYSLRGRARPWVAAPRTWDELDDPQLRHLEAPEVVARLREHGDLAAALAPMGTSPHGAAPRT